MRTRSWIGCARGGIDAVLLDIQMPELTGIEALQLFPADGPVVIFCTAHTAHAVAAFDVGAIDYLLKPVEAPRLHKALERARDRDARRRYRDELARLKATRRRALPGIRAPLARLALPTRQGIVLLDPLLMSHAELDGELVTIYSAEGQYLSALSLQELETRLPATASRASTVAPSSIWNRSRASSPTRSAASPPACAAARLSKSPGRPRAICAAASACRRAAKPRRASRRCRPCA